MKPKIRFACGLYDRMLPLYLKEVEPEGIDLEFVRMDNPRDIFDAMAARAPFEAAEMSSSEYIQRTVAGQSAFVALPVFPSRMFRHGFITINRRAVREPRDLAGKRIGVPLWTISAAVWIRGHLMHDYGVDLSNVTWIQGSINSPEAHGDPTVLPMARPPRIEQNRSGRSLSDLLAAGEIDAIIGTDIPQSIKTSPDVARLFPDFREVEKALYRDKRIYPIMHLVVVRKDVHAAHPWIAQPLFDCFNRSKAVALKRMRYLGALNYMLPWLMDDLDEIDAVFGGDPWPYGLESNRPTLEALATYLADQGIIGRKPALEELFLPVQHN